jgi:hypothetical protein
VTLHIQMSQNKFATVAFWCFDFRQLDVINPKSWHKFHILWHNTMSKSYTFLVVLVGGRAAGAVVGCDRRWRFFLKWILWSVFWDSWCDHETCDCTLCDCDSYKFVMMWKKQRKGNEKRKKKWKKWKATVRGNHLVPLGVIDWY